MSVNSIHFEGISPKTLPFVQHLLSERNGTLHTYTEWKYGKSSPQGFRGVVALRGRNPVGCFGVIPKILQVESEKIPCGWFADWYVTPSMRGSGLGARLLDEITKNEYKLLFGHPGTTQASNLCLINGWNSVRFQSSRRYIVSPTTYFGRRTRYRVKKIFLQLRNQLQVFQAKRTHPQTQPSPHQSIPRFINMDTDWIFQQPAIPEVKRNYHPWEGKKSTIAYCDDQFPSGETRRRVLSIKGMKESPEDMSTFLSHAHISRIDYLDVFTTSRWLDCLLQKSGYITLDEKPIVWKSQHHHFQEICMQGIDRENWLYLAASL